MFRRRPPCGPQAEKLRGKTLLTKWEWFGFHLVAFFIGVWDLYAIDMARAPEDRWFWIPVMAWAAGLTIHAAGLLGAGRRRAPVQDGAPQVRREEAAR